MANYDLIGNIAIVKFRKGEKLKDKKKFSERFLKEHKAVRTVLEKSNKFSGRLRTQSTKHLVGEKTKEALYKENGCLFRLNVDSCYFSPRLAAERLEVARLVKKKENVLVMFGGIAPFAIVIARTARAKKVLSVELGRECCKYAKENVKRNKLENVEIVQGDVKKVLPKMKEKFDRIVMARPNLRESFLNLGFERIKKGGIIHYYGFYPDSSKDKMLRMIRSEANKARKKIKILKAKKTGEIGARKFRWRVDLKVLGLGVD